MRRFLYWIILFSVAMCVVSIPTWLLWNWLIPDIFHGPEITILQTMGLLTLASVFVRSGTCDLHRGKKRDE